MSITINNNGGTVNIVYINESVSDARNKLLDKLYYARNKDTMGGYKAWLNLLDMYHSNDFQGMKEFISSCTGRGGKTRSECLEHINTIMKGGVN